MLYIQVDVTLIDHPKMKKLARLLGVSRMTAVGHLVALWSWAAQYATDGDLSDYREEPDVIADGAQWDGDPAQFVNALINARIGAGHGFLEDHVDGSLLLHDWQEYFGKLLERRRQDAERKRQERRQDMLTTSEDMPNDVRVTSDGHPQDTRRKSSVNVAQRSVTQNSAEQTTEAPPPGGGDPVFAQVCGVYEQNMGLLTKIISDKLSDDIATYSAPWVTDAIGIAVTAEKRNLSYVEGILRKWKHEGRTNGKKPYREERGAEEWYGEGELRV